MIPKKEDAGKSFSTPARETARTGDPMPAPQTRIKTVPIYAVLKHASARLPHPARIYRSHGLPWLATKGLLKFRHVAHNAVHAPFAGRVWIHADQHSRHFWSSVLAPDTAKAQEKALIG